jgi:mono/diheme cytochrome c family protein
MRLRPLLPTVSVLVGAAGLVGALLLHDAPSAPAAERDAPAFAPSAFLQKHCTSCHGEKAKKANLSLLDRDEASLKTDRKVWLNVLRQVQAGDMPPTGRPRPTPDEIEAFSRAVEVAFDRIDRDSPPDPGRVTVRRLNRAEYNNTIRDLVGVDFQPAEDFPSDDIGHGFDNNGDVLTLSPVLLERYLAAAESVMQRAITPDPPKPPQRYQAGRYLEPAGPNVPQTRFRPLTRGRLHTPFALSMDGEYVVRFKAYAPKVGDEPARAALLVDGKELKRFDVTATEEKNAAVYEVTTPLTKGERRVFVQLLNEGKADDRERTLFVEFIACIGPADTRPESQRRLLACDARKPRAEQTREVLERFASRAYRRPVTRDELDRLCRLVESAEKRGDKWEGAVRLAMQAVLTSPKFLFRIELDDRPDTPGPHPIDEYQLASRLSYFLWSSMPDQELFDLAAKKQLTANLDAQVRRMLRDPKAVALVDNFALQWLQLRRLADVTPDPKLFPGFDEPLRRAMLGETRAFFEHVMREDRSVLDLLDADYTFLNDRLARHYGIADTMGNWVGQKETRPGGLSIPPGRFVKVSLQGGSRGGLMTQASILTVTSNPTRTSPVKRGRWVLEQLLGTPPPPPPPDVPELKEDQVRTSGGLRQRMEQHRANPACANCHARMDPIGFAFENYNAVGAFRQKDGNDAIDASGTLPDGRSFAGPGELKAILKEKKALFARCLTEKMLTFALGRGLEYYDRRAVNRITAALAANDYKFSTLAVAIAQSDPFRLRRGKDGPP